MKVGKADFARMLDAARLARARAYAPYSGYRVGAAVITRRGMIFPGANVENATYGATICAERSAISAMVAAGELHPTACLVLTSDSPPAAPCGICRQVLAEFARDMEVVLVSELVGKGAPGLTIRRKTLGLRSLLPQAFRFRPQAK